MAALGWIEPEESGRVVEDGHGDPLEEEMASSGTTRGRKQDRTRVAGGQDDEVRYEAGKTGASKAEVKSAVKAAGNSRKKVEDELRQK
jgi:hypothetical protein